MKAFWHPLSVLLLEDLGVYATPAVVRLRLKGEGACALTYLGDAMSPAIPHGGRLVVSPPSETVRRGEVVVAIRQGILDAARVVAARGGGVRLASDTEPGAGGEISFEEIVGIVRVPPEPVPVPVRALRAILRDLREAPSHGADREDPGSSVLERYDYEAAFYAAAARPGEPTPLVLALEAGSCSGKRVVVAGCGAGRECLALARSGWSVKGIDFSPRMIRAARELSLSLGLDVEYVAADLLAHDEPEGAADVVAFTPDVYSFLPGSRARVALLARMRRWVGAEGRVLLSARRTRGTYGMAILSLQRMAHAGAQWGDSHARWIEPRGGVRRSFVHYFTRRSLEDEVRRAGFEVSDRVIAGWVLRPARGAGAGLPAESKTWA